VDFYHAHISRRGARRKLYSGVTSVCHAASESDTPGKSARLHGGLSAEGAVVRPAVMLPCCANWYGPSPYGMLCIHGLPEVPAQMNGGAVSVAASSSTSTAHRAVAFEDSPLVRTGTTEDSFLKPLVEIGATRSDVTRVRATLTSRL